ncbi:WecB/TagA/CpsF family glycosyltransferase [Candidatus Peregrinibacteria bacterium]|nr:WecB/TagA/CpsF family glycosyltransferase [Candidatus Peregrinibacteria bacterium]
MKKRFKILGIPFDAVSEEDALKVCLKALKIKFRKAFFIATPNPEMLLAAKNNKKFKTILRNSDLNIPDGIGIIWANYFLLKANKYKSKIFKILFGIISLFKLLINKGKLRSALPMRVTGTDLMHSFCQKIDGNTPIFLLGAQKEVSEKVENTLTVDYGVNIVGVNSSAATTINDFYLRNLINESKAQVLFVAFGAPKQELWLNRNLSHLKHVKLAIGVGGAFDFISGHVKRAPAWMRKIGLEWLFRLLIQPSRIKRIYNATIRFPYQVIKSSFQN